MIKKLLSAAVILALVVSAAACAGKTEPGGESAAPESTSAEPIYTESAVPESTQPSPESKMTVLDKDGARLGEIDARAVCTAVNDGIFYSVFKLGENRFTADAEYRFFDMESKRDVLLGTLEEQGYEAVYSRTEHNGRIYTLAVVGDPMSSSPVTLVLLAADPQAGSIKTYTVSETGFPYASMAVSNGKLLIMNHEMTEPKCDKIYEFDPETETMKAVLTFSSDTDSLRGVCSAVDGFYLLRLSINGGGNEMFLDLYDNNCGKVSERSVNEALIKATMEVPGILSRQDALNELGMHAAEFSVGDGRYLVYSNFGLTRVIVDLQTEETVLARSDIYSVSGGSGAPYFYRMDFDPENVEEPDITGLVDGELKKLDFSPEESHRLIKAVSNSADGTWLVETSDGFSSQDSTFVLYLWAEP